MDTSVRTHTGGAERRGQEKRRNEAKRDEAGPAVAGSPPADNLLSLDSHQIKEVVH